MNTQLIESIIKLIHALSPEEQVLLREKPFFDAAYPSTANLMTLALQGSSLDFLHEEPDLYSLDDGEPIAWS